MAELEKRWKGLETDWSQLDGCIGAAECLLRDGQRLEKWLDTKQQMLDTCIVPAADVKLVDAQLNIAKVCEENFVLVELDNFMNGIIELKERGIQKRKKLP